MTLLRRSPVLEAVLFTTGAATLSLELVASRILTPVFGSSLYVWTGILAVTLCCLALGYALGGRWSRAPGGEGVGLRYAALPLAAAAHLAAVHLLLGPVLGGLRGFDVVAGALVGCVLLLGPALVALSAMNPLLSVLAGRGRDGGGRAFAISTVGSVCGVFLTSFALIPRISAAGILLVLAAALVACGLAAGLAAVERPRRAPIRLWVGLLSAALAGSSLFPRGDTARLGGFEAERLATYRSPFGDIHVVRAAALGAPGAPALRLYVQNGGLQGGVDAGGRAVTAYTEILTHALHATRPEARDVLVVGLGPGVLPRDLAGEGRRITVFEIDPTSVAVAERHFGLPVDELDVRVGDARVLFGACPAGGYDAIVLDAFSGIEMPAHLLTVEAFREVRRCLAPGGIVLANFVLPGLDAPLTRAILRTMAAGLGGDLLVYRRGATADPGRFGTLIVLGGARWEAAPSLRIEGFPVALGLRGPATIAGRRLDPEELADAEVLTDRRNRFDWLAATAGQAAARRQITVSLPPHW